jgi:hypothetical protein
MPGAGNVVDVMLLLEFIGAFLWLEEGPDEVQRHREEHRRIIFYGDLGECLQVAQL